MNVLVTAISGNLGQAICKMIRKHFSDATIIGTDAINPLQGYGLCNVLIKIPYAQNVAFLPSIMNIVEEYKIDLIIPSNDFELEVLNANSYLSSITLATRYTSSANILDKYLCYEEFKKNGITFCRSFLPSN